MCKFDSYVTSSVDYRVFFLIFWCVRCGLFFFFQAEDGIRDLYVTGVQTCALPICRRSIKACRESPVFATSTALPAGVFMSTSPATPRDASKPLSIGGTGVKWPFPSPRNHSPFPASGGVVDRKSVV